MNPLAQLVSDLDLDRDLVLRRLRHERLCDFDCVNIDDIPDVHCLPACDFIMRVLRE